MFEAFHNCKKNCKKKKKNKKNKNFKTKNKKYNTTSNNSFLYYSCSAHKGY